MAPHLGSLVYRLTTTKKFASFGLSDKKLFDLFSCGIQAPAQTNRWPLIQFLSNLSNVMNLSNAFILVLTKIQAFKVSVGTDKYVLVLKTKSWASL